MQQLIYLSTATQPFTDDELQALLRRARQQNEQYGITGLLLYHQGRIMQLIEGAPETVDRLYQNILRDPRHTGAIRLADKEVASRSFPSWSMAFQPVGESAELTDMAGYQSPEQLALPATGLSAADALLLNLMHTAMLRGEP